MYHTPQRTRLVKKTQRENVYARVCVCMCVVANLVGCVDKLHTLVCD